MCAYVLSLVALECAGFVCIYTKSVLCSGHLLCTQGHIWLMLTLAWMSQTVGFMVSGNIVCTLCIVRSACVHAAGTVTHPSCYFIGSFSSCCPTYIRTVHLRQRRIHLGQVQNARKPAQSHSWGKTILLSHVLDNVVCVYVRVTTTVLHYIFAGVTKDSSLVPGAATQVILGNCDHLEHTTPVRTCIHLRIWITYAKLHNLLVLVDLRTYIVALMMHTYMYVRIPACITMYCNGSVGWYVCVFVLGLRHGHRAIHGINQIT